MFFQRFRHRAQREERKEIEIQSIRQETLKHARVAAENTDKLIKLLEDDNLGVTGRIFYATGGDRRSKR